MKRIRLNNSPLLVFVDDEDFPLLSRMEWCIDDGGYARNDQIRMHRLILGFPGKEIDHIDRNRLNNQKNNLRQVTKQHNLMNRPAQRNGSSGFKGVYQRGSSKKPWMANITKKSDAGKQKTYHIGYFETAQEAARAYDAKARELYGEFAYQNFPS